MGRYLGHEVVLKSESFIRRELDAKECDGGMRAGHRPHRETHVSKGHYATLDERGRFVLASAGFTSSVSFFIIF